MNEKKTDKQIKSSLVCELRDSLILIQTFIIYDMYYEIVKSER